MIQRIGITGNIGSGKTTVAKLFERLGIPVYYADQEAKMLMHTSPEIRQKIVARFGEKSYSDFNVARQTATDSYPTLNREHLASQVFNDQQALADLNAIVHPAVARHALEWHEAQTAPYTLYEAAITFETGGNEVLDKVMVVHAPQTIRLERVTLRDGLARKQVLARMDKQWSDEKKIELADFVIHNHAHHLLMPQVVNIHGQLLTDH